MQENEKSIIFPSLKPPSLAYNIFKQVLYISLLTLNQNKVMRIMKKMFASAIKLSLELRLSKGMTLEEASAIVSLPFLSKFERGEHELLL